MVSYLVIGGGAGCANKVVYEPLEMSSKLHRCTRCAVYGSGLL